MEKNLMANTTIPKCLCGRLMTFNKNYGTYVCYSCRRVYWKRQYISMDSPFFSNSRKEGDNEQRPSY